MRDTKSLSARRKRKNSGGNTKRVFSLRALKTAGSFELSSGEITLYFINPRAVIYFLTEEWGLSYQYAVDIVSSKAQEMQDLGCLR